MPLRVRYIIRLAVPVSVSVLVVLGVEGHTAMGVMEATQISFGPVGELSPQLSPDGLKIAFEYFAAKNDQPKIWVMDRYRGFETARSVVDNERFNAEFSWSSDGKWISYITDVNEEGGSILIPEIRKVRLSDGHCQRITTPGKWRVLGNSTSWRGDRIVFSDEKNIYAVSASGGEEAKIVDVQGRVPSAIPLQVRWSPDGRRLAFTIRHRDSEPSNIWVANINSNDMVQLTHSGADDFPSWVDNERLVFTRTVPPTNEDGGTTQNEARVCLVEVKSGSVKCVTSGHIDFTPWVDHKTGELFVARIAADAVVRSGLVVGFHIWKLRLP